MRMHKDSLISRRTREGQTLWEEIEWIRDLLIRWKPGLISLKKYMTAGTVLTFLSMRISCVIDFEPLVAATPSHMVSVLRTKHDCVNLLFARFGQSGLELDILGVFDSRSTCKLIFGIRCNYHVNNQSHYVKGGSIGLSPARWIRTCWQTCAATVSYTHLTLPTIYSV